MSDGGWSFGGSILTFAFPMLLFIGVAVALYVLYTKPSAVPGHRTPTAERPVSYTAIPGTPTATATPSSPTATAIPSSPTATAIPGSPAAAPGNLAADDAAMATGGENAALEAHE